MDVKLALLFVMFVAQGFSYPEEENNYDPELFQSDMRLSPMQRLLAETGGDVSKAKSFESNTFGSAKDIGMLWLPERIVPYTISKKLAANAEATLGIMLAMREWESHTCLKFVERTVETNYIEFFNNCSGCWSYVGRVGGKQNICLSNGCSGKGTIIHEIAHAMGFWHEQSRPDRDSYIRVVWDNIPQEKKHNFKKHNNSEVDSLGTKYDYTSVMQYSKTAFGISGSVTMDPILPGVFQLGQRVGFTDIDSVQANMLYRCNGTTTRPKIIPKKVVLTGKNDCDFDSGFCHFQQDQNDDFDFSLRIGGTPSWGTGPDTDHTTRRMGAYAYIETSSPRKQFDTARLVSKVFRWPKVACMTFHYHMMAFNASHMGSFNVYIKNMNSGEEKLLFSENTPQGSEWIKESITLRSQEPYRVVFEATRGGGYQGDIAIDDVSFSRGACQDQPDPQPPTPGKCEDVKDRENKYCAEWSNAGLCSFYKKDMEHFCPKTCAFCK